MYVVKPPRDLYKSSVCIYSASKAKVRPQLLHHLFVMLGIWTQVGHSFKQSSENTPIKIRLWDFKM